jgi:DNA polymerase-3 subunit beta
MTATLAPAPSSTTGTTTGTTTITIARGALKTALGKLAAAVDTSSKAHALSQHIRFDVAPGRITLTATDFEAFVRLHVTCDASGTASVLLPAKRLSEIVAALPPVSAVTLLLSATKAVLTAGRSRFELLGMDVADFPVLPEIESTDVAVLEAATFLDAIERAATHASTEDARAALNVVRLWPVDGQLVAAGIDGSRMARLPAGAVQGDFRGACSLHRTAAPLLARLFTGLPDAATLRVSMDEHRCLIASDDATAIVRLVDLTFPELAPVVARVNPTRVVACDRLLLSSAIRRVALAAGATRRVELTLADEITVRAEENALGTAADVVTIDEIRTGDREPLAFTINATFALAALDTLTAQVVTIAVDTRRLPILFRAADQAPSDPTLVLVQPLNI